MAQIGTLYFICGKIAAGKTTLARKIAAEKGAVFICEDEWFSKLFPNEIKSLEDYVERANRLKAILAVHVQALLERGTSVVFDFSGNTARHRAWVRSVFEAAGADHALYVLDVTDDECKRRLARRNAEKPVGLYFGVSPTEADFDLFTKYFSTPSSAEGFQVVVVEKDGFASGGSI